MWGLGRRRISDGPRGGGPIIDFHRFSIKISARFALASTHYCCVVVVVAGDQEVKEAPRRGFSPLVPARSSKVPRGHVDKRRV
jgi:hypothetical protein